MGVTEELEDVAAMVTVAGPDPKGVKAERVPFHAATTDGTTSVSVSGLVMPSIRGESQGECTVICPAHAVRLFMRPAGRSQPASPQATEADLLPGCRIEVAMQGSMCRARLMATFPCPEASTLIKAVSAGSGEWRLGWQTAPAAHVPEMAILSCPLQGGTAQPRPQHTPAPLAESRKGASFTAMGSPFGALAPAHFLNHTAAGVISNVLRPAVRSGQGDSAPGLLLADMQCLPGMEGGPVMSARGKLIGVLCQPLCSQSFEAEVPLILPYNALMRAFRARRDTPVRGSHSSPAALPSESTQQELPDWSKRLAQTRSLPPPWHTPSVSPTIIAQPASAPESHHAAPLGSTSFQGHVWQRTCMQPAQSQDSVRPLAHQHVQESGHCLPRPSRPESQRSITQCSQCTGFGEESHGSLSSGSRQPQKHAQRLNMIRNHLCASEQPDHKSLETSQLEASSPARPQLCSSEAPTPEHEGHPQVYRAGEERHPSGNLEAAVAAAEGSVVALMSPTTGAWASGIIVSAAHGYILTVAHLLSERSQHPAQHSQPMSMRPSHAVPTHSRECSYHILPHEEADSIGHIREPCMGGIAQQHCSSAYPHRLRRGDVLVQMRAPEHTLVARKGNELERQSHQSTTAEVGMQLTWTSASLVYRFKGPLDIAVLQLDDLSLSSSLHDFELRPAGGYAPRKGERVAVMGFPLLSPRMGFGSCATAGIIAKVVLVDIRASSHMPANTGEECMFMTGASVHPGASGGAVIDEAGRLLGMVTSNTKHLRTGRSLARLNYSLPAAALRPLWDLLRSSPSADMEAIRQLDADSPALRQVWALSSGLSPDAGRNGATERLQRLLRDKSIRVAGHAQ